MTPIQPPNHSNSHWTVLNLLRGIILLQSIGVAGKYLFARFESDSDIYELLFFDWGWPEPVAQLIDDAGAWTCLVAASLIFAAGFAHRYLVADAVKLLRLPDNTSDPQELNRRASSRRRLALMENGLFWTRIFEIGSVWLIIIWMFVLATTDMVRGGLFAELSLGENAVRFASPLFFWMLMMSESSQRHSATIPSGWTDANTSPTRKRVSLPADGEAGRDTLACASGLYFRLRRFMATTWTKPTSRWLRWGIVMLSLATAATFAVHGYKAFSCYGYFADLILLSDKHWLGIGPEQSTVEKGLVAIGVVDFVAAGLLVITRCRFVAAYMVLWGLVTAASRITAFGFAAWPELLIRSANWGAPLVLLWYFHTSRQKNE